jgi:hypothetical protein
VGHAAGVESELRGGVANAGAVTRSGDHVLRPSNVNTPTIHRFLRSLAWSGFDGASAPAGEGVDPDGRERLRYIDGKVAVPPYPDWAQSDDALASIARLMRRFHDAAVKFIPAADDTWSAELADPTGGLLICHNDVCLENVVFRDGKAVGLLDFDFAAPGHAEYDLACFARMCVSIDDPESRAKLGWHPSETTDLARRLRIVADAYGLEEEGRHALLEALSGTIARGGEFVLRHVEAGEQPFIEMWNTMGGMARFDRRRAWWTTARADFERALEIT